MAKKKNKIIFTYDSPVALTFTLITVIVFLLNTLVLKGKIDSFFYAPTNARGAFPFTFTDVYSYLRLVLYQFGYFDMGFLFADLIIILLLGQILEERYGSFIMALMMFFSTLFSGVLTACFCSEKICGASAIVIMMVFLNTLTSISKKKVSVLSVVAIALVISREFFARSGGVKENGFIGVILAVAGGLCGSLFAFLASPKARAASKKESGLKAKAELLEELDAASPRNKAKKSSSEDETVVIGTLEL